MSRRALTLACGDYDRTRPLAAGDVRPAGVELTVLALEVEEIFFRMVQFAEFDASELSFGSYLVSLARAEAEGAEPPFVAIPAFPSRSFRHSGIYVNRAIQTPADLRGATVGVAEYQLTANIWIRGILQEHYGVPFESVRYRTGGLHAPGRVEKQPLALPASVDIAPIGPGQTLSAMLADGEIDAIYSPRTPSCFTAGRPGVRRLFGDYRGEEHRYWDRTGIFPPMHVVALRGDVYRRDRWLARSLLDAFEQARRIARDRLADTAALACMLPWLSAEVASTAGVMGTDYWTYGVQGNETAIDALARYAHLQHLIPRPFGVEELFAPETMASAIV